MSWRLRADAYVVAFSTLLLAVPPVRSAGEAFTTDSLVVVTWNVEWFGHPGYPPENDALQIINVADVIRGLQAHLYALQEIASAAAFQQLLSLLGHPYAGLLSDSGASQRLAFVYDSEVFRVEWSTDQEFSAHAHSFAGRLPLVLRAQPKIGTQDQTWTFVTVHMKAFFDADSRARRAMAGTALKEYTDQIAMWSPLVVLGDFNDDFEYSLGGGPSPYAAILFDSSRYFVPTLDLSRADEYTFCADSDCGSGSVIDHVVTSRRLAHHVIGVGRATEVLQEVASFVATTSDHLPVRVVFHVSRSNSSVPGKSPTAATIRVRTPHPNPAETFVIVPIELTASAEIKIEAIDVIGRSRTLRPESSFDAGYHHLPLSMDGLSSGPWIICASTQIERSCSVVSKVRPR